MQQRTECGIAAFLAKRHPNFDAVSEPKARAA
jgi:hypothetical protein